MLELYTYVKSVMDANFPSNNSIGKADDTATIPWVVWNFMPSEPKQIFSGGHSWRKIPLQISYYHTSPVSASTEIPLIEAMFSTGALTADSIMRWEHISDDLHEDPDRSSDGNKIYCGRLIVKAWFEKG